MMMNEVEIIKEKQHRRKNSRSFLLYIFIPVIMDKNKNQVFAYTEMKKKKNMNR